jgi:hypothetical protein
LRKVTIIVLRVTVMVFGREPVLMINGDGSQ